MAMLREETMGSQGANQTCGSGDETGSHAQRPRDARRISAQTCGRSGIAAETRQGDDIDGDACPDEGQPRRAHQASVRTRETPKFMNGRHGFR
jgi:hypothetical protein